MLIVKAAFGLVYKCNILLKRYTFLPVSFHNLNTYVNENAVVNNSTYEKASAIPDDNIPHTPVMLSEVIQHLSLKINGVYLDMTFGCGMHSRKILEYDPSIIVHSLDRDPATQVYAEELKKRYPNRFHSLFGKFSDLPELLAKKRIGGQYFDGILMDLGASSLQFNFPERGFMLSKDGPLDMRMDGPNNEPTAADVIAHLDEESLRKIFKTYGQEKKAKMIAAAIVEYRRAFKPIKTTKELAEVISSVTGIEYTRDKLGRFAHPATRTFQALRIFVNDELNQLDHGIRLAHYYLQLGGILVTIAFHSLEDTIIKRHFTGKDLDIDTVNTGKPIWKNSKNPLTTYSMDELEHTLPQPWKHLTKHTIVPTEEERSQNPRSRSAKLRAASKLYFIYS